MCVLLEALVRPSFGPLLTPSLSDHKIIVTKLQTRRYDDLCAPLRPAQA